MLFIFISVESFDAAVRKVAEQLDQPIDFVGAQAVGRFKNGTPLAISGTPEDNFDATGEGKFDYDDDDDGDKCPLHAHIRKVNPRNSLGFIVNLFAREKTRRIARRGITYGDRPDRETGGEPPSGGVGLIFICYQNDISDQFEFIQEQWANDRRFPRRGKAGIDPVIGRAGGEEIDRDDPHYPTRWDAPDDDRQRVKFGEHVRLRGGEYFYAPSMEALIILGAPQ